MKRMVMILLAGALLLFASSCAPSVSINSDAPISPDALSSEDDASKDARMDAAAEPTDLDASSQTAIGSANDDVISYIGESGTEFVTQRGHAQLRLATYKKSDDAVVSTDEYDIANIMDIDSQWVNKLSEDSEGGLTDAFYEINEAYALEISRKYADALNGGNLSMNQPFAKTFESGDMFPIILYEAGYDYIGSGSITRGLADSDFLGDSFDVHMTLQIKTGVYSYLHVYYPSELKLLDSYAGGVASDDKLYDVAMGGNQNADETMHHFFFSGFDGSKYVDLYFSADSYTAGDHFTWEQLNSASYSALRRADYDLGFIRRDPFFTTDSIDAVSKFNVHIVERDERATVIYFHMIAVQANGEPYELEGLGCTAVNGDTSNAASGDDHMCAICGGDGKMRCTKCSGTGKVRKMNAATGGYTSVICTKCNGAGKTVCWRCNGSGRNKD